MKRKNQIIAMLLAATMLTTEGVSGINVWAEPVVVSEESTEQPYELTYTELEDGTLEITGYTGEASGDLVIPDEIDGKAVTKIGNGAFSYCRGFNGKLTLPSGLKNIGNHAFYVCSFTGTLDLPDSLESIGDRAFGLGDYTGSVVIPKNVTSIGIAPFVDCYDLEEIQVADGNVMYMSHDNVLYDKTGETLIQGLPPKSDAIEILSTVKTIGAESLTHYGITGKISISATVENIERYAFMGCGATEFYVEEENAAYMSYEDALYTKSGETLIAYPRNRVGEIVFSPTVTEIGEHAFSNCYNIRGTLVLPETVTKINSSAFGQCRNMSGILIPLGLTSIENYAFNYCENLKNVYYAGDETAWNNISIGTENDYLLNANINLNFTGTISPFAYTELEDGTIEITGYTGEASGDLVIPDEIDGKTVTKIGDMVFWDNTGFTGTLTLPKGLTEISEYAFYGCTGLTGDISIPESVTAIGDWAFGMCDGFDGTLTLPEGLISIGERAFFQCTNLSGHLDLPDSLETIGYQAFIRCSGLRGDLILPSNLTSIADGAFANCGFDGQLVLPEGIESIGEGAFSVCSSLSGTLQFPNSLTSIGATAFRSCSGLTGEVEIPVNVQAIGEAAFRDCEGLTGISVASENEYYTSKDGVLYTKAEDALIAYPAGKTEEPEILSTVTRIEPYAFAGCYKLDGTLKIPEGVTVIGKGGLMGCGIKSIVVPISLKEVEELAFIGCMSLTNVYYAGTETDWNNIVIGEQNILLTDAKRNYITADGFVYTGLEDGTIEISGYTGDAAVDLVIPSEIDGKTVTSIGDKAFAYCDGLTGMIVLPDTLKNIGYRAFYQCTGLLGNLNIPASVTKLGVGAFSDCNGITAFLVSEENETYMDSNGIVYTQDGETLVVCPAGLSGSLGILGTVKVIEEEAFCGCSKLTGTFCLPDTLVEIKEDAFWGCSGFSGEIVLPASIEVIGPGAFRGCVGITGFDIPEENTAYKTIDGAIYSESGDTLYICPGAKSGELVIPSTVTTISFFAAYECPNLTSVYIPKSVTTINSFGIGYCENVTDIYYGGSEEEWAAITMQNGNEALTNATLHYNSVEPEEEITFTYKELSDGTLKITGYEGEASGDLIIPAEIDGKKVASIGDNAFEAETGFDGKLVLPEGLTSIGMYAFSACEGLNGEVVLPESLTTLGACAFSKCTGLTGIMHIPANLTSIGGSAFIRCSGLTAYEVAEENTAYKSVDGILYTKAGDTLVFFPGGKTGEVEILDTVTTIGFNSFIACKQLTGKLRLPNGVTDIKTGAFAECSNLESIVIPGGLTTVEYGAFRDASGLKDVYFSGSEEAWKAISIADFNDALINANIHFKTIGAVEKEDLAEEIEKMEEGNKVEVEIQEETPVLPSDVLETVKDKDVTIEITISAGMIWGINGKDVSATGDVNLAVKKTDSESGNIEADIVTNLAGDRESEQLVFGQEGDFAFTGTLTLKVPSAILGNKAVFMQMAEGELSLSNSAKIEDGNMTFEVSNGADSAIIYGLNGDSSGDNKVDMRDLMQILYNVSKRTDLNDVQKGFADVNTDGKVEMRDLMRELYFISGRSNEL